MSEKIIEVKDLQKWFPVRRNIGEFFRGEHRYVKAVDGVSFSIKRGEIFGLVGESGCGKTTTGKLIMKLLEPTGGTMLLDGKDVTHIEKEELKKYKITEITEYIFAHYKDITLKDLAAHFNYSCAYLSTVIKKYSGNSFSELLHAFRFLRACQLLTESDTSISDIIEDVGCSNQTWFIQNFKKRYGISPSEYRRRYRK